MFYRVDYLLAVIVGGVLVGAAIGSRTSRIEPERLANYYLRVVAILVVLKAVFFVCGTVLAHPAVWNRMGSAIGDTNSFVFGIIFGVATRRDHRKLLCDSAIFSALCLATGVGFVTAGYSKALYMQGMIDFFTQSGYSTQFLKFIMAAEVFGGIGLLIPWTVVPATLGLSLDMFGAIYTHVHNGDPLNDSTGAISMLIRLAAIVTLWAWRPRAELVDSVRKRFVAVALAAAMSIIGAVVGSTLIRWFSPPVPAHSAIHEFSNPTFQPVAHRYNSWEQHFGTRLATWSR
jgi:uncharacterized membrane protein YphA (DoxX/SURF4 family)